MKSSRVRAPGVRPRRASLGALIFWGLLLLSCRPRNAGSPEAPFRLCFFPNLTHAQALVGNNEGLFRKALGGKPVKVLQFNAGPAAMEALLARAVDVTYVGGGPAITAYVRSEGRLRVIAGATSGGALLVARTARTPQDLEGQKVAVPQLGNSQDIALRHWLAQQGLKPANLGGRVQVLPQANPEIMTLFKRGEIEAAWVPEPWASRLIQEAGGHVLVDERDLWPGGRFPTTVLVATEEAIRHRREDVKAVLRTHVELTRRASGAKEVFAQQANKAFQALTGKAVSSAVLTQAFSRMEFQVDPMASQLAEMAASSEALGYIPHSDLSGLVDPSLLQEVEQEGVGGSGP